MDNLSVASVNTVKSTTQQLIFEGFLFEDPSEILSGKSCSSQTLKTCQRRLLDKKLSHQRACASWNSENDFIYITSTLRPFRIYFDDIIAIYKVEPGKNLFLYFK